MSGIVVQGWFGEDAPKRRHEEAKLQKQVVTALRWLLPDHSKLIVADAGVPLHGKARAIRAGRGIEAGIPDLQVIWRGDGRGTVVVFIELKAPKGWVAPHQQQMMNKLNDCGCWTFVCRSEPEVMAALREAGIPMREKVG